MHRVPPQSPRYKSALRRNPNITPPDAIDVATEDLVRINRVGGLVGQMPQTLGGAPAVSDTTKTRRRGGGLGRLLKNLRAGVPFQQ